MLNYVELLLFPGVDEVLNKKDARGYTPLIIGAQVEKSRESENFSGWGGVPFWRARGGVWRKIERGVCVRNTKNSQKTVEKTQNFIEQVFFSLFLLQIMPPASEALRSHVFCTKLVETKHQVVHG